MKRRWRLPAQIQIEDVLAGFMVGFLCVFFVVLFVIVVQSR